MRTAGKIVADQCILCPEDLGEHPVQCLPSTIAIPVTGRGCKVALADTVFDKSGQHLLLIIFRNTVNLTETVCAQAQSIL